MHIKHNDFPQYREALLSEFARYGFMDCPLTELEMKLCHSGKATIKESYALGCDLYCNPDMDILEAWLANVGVKDNA